MAEHDEDASSLSNELCSGGYSTVAVQSGAQVLGRARNDDFDLLILELDLPGPSAWATYGGSSAPTSSTRCAASAIGWVRDTNGAATLWIQRSNQRRRSA